MAYINGDIMKNFVELTPKDLELTINNLPNFTTTMEIVSHKGIIGQDRAVRSIDIGLDMDKKGYNIFISGHSGTGKTGYIVKKIEEHASKLPTPNDWCYVYNFDDENTPTAINLEPETAIDFKEEISELIDSIFKDVPIFFNSESYERERTNIISKYEKEILSISEELSIIADEKDFKLEEDPAEGFIFIPLKDGKEMDSEDYTKLSSEEKILINENANELRLLSIEIFKKTKSLNKNLEEELKNLDQKVGNNIIGDKISILKNKYGTNEGVINYLNSLKDDIIHHIQAFLEDESEEAKKNKELEKLFFRRYEVNVIVNNREGKGAPVIFEDSPEYDNLFGKIEYENKFGNLITDFTLLRPGSLHKANGGYLIINMHKLLTNPVAWENLKRCLQAQSVILENSKNGAEMLPIISLKPENIPLNTKIILIGSDMIYSLLLERDYDFAKLFKIKAEFDNEIELKDKNINEFLGFISSYITKNKMLHITKNGIIELIKFSCRLAENRNYFSSSMTKLIEIIDLSNYFAKKEKSNLVRKDHIKLALNEAEDMHSLSKKKTLEMYKNKKYVVDLSGSRIGQINGLSVLDYGDCIIGQQHRITVATYAGKEGITNIEREADMSGNIHSKGIMILSGYVGELLGQDVPLSFNASIVFEQLYSGIEGDSASAAELLALLSSLSDIPLNQSMAITGSVNQKGEIQPIGGVNEKIEGYFDICEIFGLNGNHGVIIPSTNIDDLVLNDKVIEAVAKGLFHIYAVNTIEDCFEILCDTSYKANINCNLISHLKDKIMVKLNKYNNIIKPTNC